MDKVKRDSKTDEWQSLEVTFETKISKAENCICAACHGTGRVIQIRLPETLFFDGGHGLSTKYRNYWLCAPCRAKLVRALDWTEADKHGQA